MTRSQALSNILRVVEESKHNSDIEKAAIMLFEIEKFMLPKPIKVVVGRKFNMDIEHDVYAFEEPNETE